MDHVHKPPVASTSVNVTEVFREQQICISMVSMYLRIYLSTHPSIHCFRRSRLSIHLSVCLLSIDPSISGQHERRSRADPSRRAGLHRSIYPALYPSIYLYSDVFIYRSIVWQSICPSVIPPSIYPSIVCRRASTCVAMPLPVRARARVCMSCPLPPLGTRRQLDPPLYLEQCARAPQSTQSLLSFQVVPNADEKVPPENPTSR